MAEPPGSLCLCSKDESAYMAGPLTARGVAVVVVGYTLAPKGKAGGPEVGEGGRGAGWGASPHRACPARSAPGTLDRMVDQVARSLAFLQTRFPCNQWVSPQASWG